jgi:hypothetical protein
MSEDEPDIEELRRLWEGANGPGINPEAAIVVTDTEFALLQEVKKAAFPRLLEIAERYAEAQIEINRLNELRERDLGIILRLQHAHHIFCTQCDEQISEILDPAQPKKEG